MNDAQPAEQRRSTAITPINRMRRLPFSVLVTISAVVVDCAGALSYGGAWRTRLCTPEVAASLAGDWLAASDERALWIAVDRTPGAGGKLTDRAEPPITGRPDALG